MKDIFEPLADSITSQIIASIAAKSTEPTTELPEETLEEMSAMAGGAVQGHSGNAFIGEKDDEQKRPTA